MSDDPQDNLIVVANDAGEHASLAPAATPKPVIDRLSAELRKVVGDPTLTARFAAIGFEPTPSSSKEMALVMRRTAEDWIPVIRQLNIKMD